MSDWPPDNGRKFVRGEEFGNLVVGETKKLAKAYPAMDFTDAVALVFTWFIRKLRENGSFINAKRFKTRNSFKRYVIHAIFNTARQAQRNRSKGLKISEVPPEEDLVFEPSLSQDELDALLDKVDKLQEPHKTVFEKLFFDEENREFLASSMGLEVEEVDMLYEDAIDQLPKL